MGNEIGVILEGNMNIAILHHSLFEHQSGSAEKLLRDIAINLSQRPNISITLIYGNSKNNIDINNYCSDNIYHEKFEYSSININRPCSIENISLDINSILHLNKINIVIALVWSWSIDHLEKIPKDICLYLISPFGHIISHPNIGRILVSGHANCRKLLLLGFKNTINFLNPLNIEKYSPENHELIDSEEVIYARLGRSDPYLFDPISLRAFKLLQEEFPGRVKFVYVNPCSRAREFVKINDIKAVEFREWLSEDELIDFYHSFDVLCHARYDGETLGVAIIEALLSGKVVVSHKSHIYNEHLKWLKSPFGRYVPKGDVIGYYWGLRDFYLNKNSLRSYGELGRGTLLNIFDSNRVFQRIYHDLFRLRKGGKNNLPFRFYIFLKLLKLSDHLKKVIKKGKLYEFFRQAGR